MADPLADVICAESCCKSRGCGERQATAVRAHIAKALKDEEGRWAPIVGPIDEGALAAIDSLRAALLGADGG